MGSKTEEGPSSVVIFRVMDFGSSRSKCGMGGLQRPYIRSHVDRPIHPGPLVVPSQPPVSITPGSHFNGAKRFHFFPVSPSLGVLGILLLICRR